MNLSHVSLWAITAWAVAGVWIFVITVFTLACRKRSVLKPLRDRPQLSDVPRLSVIVAAKNESECIETCIRSLFRQDYPGLEVVAVNDRSIDDTGAILDRLAVEFPDQMRVVHVTTLPSGWFGKPNALTLGLQRATGSLVCFTDADCVFLAPSAFRTAVTEMLGRQIDFLSIAARYSMSSVRECVAVPCSSEMLMTWLRPERVEDPNWPDAFANGAFILVRREPFEAIGGWSAVRTQISEDLQLARLAKRSGLRVGVALGEGFYETGSYRTWRDSWNGWSRIFKGTLTPAQLMITIGRMLLLFALPLGAILWGLVDGLRTGSFTELGSTAGVGFIVAFALRALLDVTVFRLVGAPVWAAVLAPLGRIFVMAAAARALCSHAGLVHTYWRGSTFSAGQLILPGHTKPESQIP